MMLGRLIRRIAWLIIAVVVIYFFVQAWFPPLESNIQPLDDVTINSVAVAAACSFLFGFLFRRIRWIQHMDTWIHEFGHAVTASLLGGVPTKIQLNKDSSGVTHFPVNHKLNRTKYFIICAAGPLASTFTFFIAMIFAVRGQSENVMLVSSAIVLLVLFTTVRSLWGWLVGIVVWGAMAFVTSLANGWIFGSSHLLIQGCFLAAMTGVGAGVATRASMRMLRFNGPRGDEGKMAAILHLPETLVDLAIVLINVAVAGAAFYTLRVFETSFFTETAPQILSTSYSEVLSWIQGISGK